MKRKTSRSRFSRGPRSMFEVVSNQSPPSEAGAGPHIESEVDGSLLVVWNHGQLDCFVAIPWRRDLYLDALALTATL